MSTFTLDNSLFSSGIFTQGTALFMSNDLLSALITVNRGGIKNDFTFQHKLCNDLESLIWVVIYAMMIRRRNTLAATDSNQSALFQGDLDGCWGGHSYGHLWSSHNNMVSAGCSPRYHNVENLWFPVPVEAAFFRDSMRLVRGQEQDDKLITYDGLCTVFQKYIRLAREANESTVTSD